MNDTIRVVQYIVTGNALQDGECGFGDLLCRACSIHTAIVLVALGLAVWLWYRHRRMVRKSMLPTVLLWSSVVVFVFGTAVYAVGSLQSERMGFCDALYTIPSAIISSLGMFFYQDDISELTDTAKTNSIFMACYSLAHFFAAVIMSFVVLRLLGMRIVYWFRLKNCHPKRLYVFWGISPQAMTLAESIHDESKNKGRGVGDIVFVNTVEEEREENNAFRLLDIIRTKGSIDEKADEMGAMLVNCYEDIADSRVCKGDSLDGAVRRGARLNYLAKALAKACELHLFFLSDNEDRNINSASNVIKIIEAECNKDPQRHKRRTHVYCHAHHSAKTQEMDFHDIVKFDTEPMVHVIDSSALAVANLKKNVEDCPVSFVEIDKETATVKSDFRALIIGFGETGEETLKFLYEFGAFVDDKGEKTPFHCTVIDEKASRLEGDFYTKAPALTNLTDIKIDKVVIEKQIRFKECPIGSKAYWDVVRKEIEDGLNYVMVSVGDDNTGLNAAVDICRQAAMWRKETDGKLNIYIRCSRQENYERIHSSVMKKRKYYAESNITLKVFGDFGDVFNYKTIVDDTVLKDAKRYNWEYSKTCSGKENPNPAKVPTCSEMRGMDLCWIEQLKLIRTQRKPTIWNIEDSIRRRDQNMSNVFHIDTKMYILDKVGMDVDYWRGKDLDKVLERQDDKDNNGKEYKTPYYIHLPDKEKLMLTNIARLEHERWMAASRMQGWQSTENSTEEKDERQKLHNDMRSWDTLRSEGAERLKTQAYDCAVVDTTIKIMIEDIITNDRQRNSTATYRAR